MGLAGNTPERVDIDSIAGFIARVEETERLPVGMHCHTVSFPRDLTFATILLERFRPTPLQYSMLLIESRNLIGLSVEYNKDLTEYRDYAQDAE